ncbi:MAG: hypothetical protein ACTSRI_00325, partial [Promethearchaeota archaeon]
KRFGHLLVMGVIPRGWFPSFICRITMKAYLILYEIVYRGIGGFYPEYQCQPSLFKWINDH